MGGIPIILPDFSLRTCVVARKAIRPPLGGVPTPLPTDGTGFEADGRNSYCHCENSVMDTRQSIEAYEIEILSRPTFWASGRKLGQ